MVATQLPNVTRAALRVLEDGGNAADAFVTAVFLQHVEDFHQVSHFGAMSGLYYEAATGTTYAFNAFSERPRADRCGDGKRVGRLAIGGTVSGLESIAERFGTRPWASYLEPAITAAEAGRPGHELPVREQLQPLGERGPDPGERGGAGLLHARGSPGPGRRDLEDAGARLHPARRRRARRRPPLQGRLGEEVRGTGHEPRLLRHPRRPRGVRDALARAGPLHLPGPRDPGRAPSQQGRAPGRAEPERIGAVRPDGHGSLRRVPGDPRDHGPELRQGGVGHEVVHPGPGRLLEPLRTLELEGVRAAERRVRPADHAAAGGGPDGDDGEGSGAERTLPPR